MARVIIVSNRLPVSVKKVNGKLEYTRSIGGLSIGLASYVNNPRNRWIGWPGIATDDLTEAEQHDITTELNKHHCTPVFLSQKEIDNFYNGYSNRILWPLLHDMPTHGEEESSFWKAYRTVNALFSEVVASISSPTTTIWVHDYQLMLLPSLLRSELPDSKIGFFLHVPFPKPKKYSTLKHAYSLLAGVVGADLIGFHTESYVRHFLECAQYYDIGLIENQQIKLTGRSVSVSQFPIGIDYKMYKEAKKNLAVKLAIRRYKRKYRGKKVIADAGRLEPNKGLVEKLEAYKEFLRVNPRLHGKVVFAMVVAPSRTDIDVYRKLAAKLEKLAGEINQQYGTTKWRPLDYIDTAQPFEEISALLSIADVAFITPLVDGMNLVAKEYVASRHSDGALILSETAGVAEELTDALIVNPKHRQAQVDALTQALTMPKRERKRRLRAMKKKVSTNTVQSWAGGFIQTLQRSLPKTPSRTASLSPALQHQLISHYRSARSRLIVLDYDGTLRSFAESYKEGEPSRQVVHLLKKLTTDSANAVVLISGRSRQNLDEWFSSTALNLVAEHGALVRKAGQRQWHETSEKGRRWKKAIRPVLAQYTELTPKAELEEKQFSLVWHYRQSPTYYAQKNSVILQRLLQPLLQPYGLSVFSGNKILEVKDPKINKGTALRDWLKTDYDFVLGIGDDFTDEDTFLALPRQAYTIKVGRGRTAAAYRLTSYHDVLSLLKKLTR